MLTAPGMQLETHGYSIFYQSSWSGNATGYGKYSDVMRTDTISNKYLARAHHQLPGSIGFRMVGSSLSTKMSMGLLFPNPSDNGFYVQSEPPMIFAGETDFRGYMPGVRNPLASNVGMDKAILKSMPNITGRALLCLLVANDSYPRAETTTNSIMCFDITG